MTCPCCLRSFDHFDGSVCVPCGIVCAWEGRHVPVTYKRKVPMGGQS